MASPFWQRVSRSERRAIGVLRSFDFRLFVDFRTVCVCFVGTEAGCFDHAGNPRVGADLVCEFGARVSYVRALVGPGVPPVQKSRLRVYCTYTQPTDSRRSD